jgi:hypothetical protein
MLKGKKNNEILHFFTQFYNGFLVNLFYKVLLLFDLNNVNSKFHDFILRIYLKLFTYFKCYDIIEL